MGVLHVSNGSLTQQFHVQYVISLLVAGGERKRRRRAVGAASTGEAAGTIAWRWWHNCLVPVGAALARQWHNCLVLVGAALH